MDRIISYTATRTTKTKKTSSLVAHSVILANQAGRSDMLEPTTLVLLLTNMAVQTFVRLESPSKGSPFTDAMISSPALAVTTLVLTGAPACFLLTSLVVPRLHKQQQQGLEAYSASMWTDLYMFAHVANFFVCTPLIVGLLASSVLVQICGLSYPGDNLVSHTVYGASAIFGLALMAFFVSFYLGAFRPRDCFSCTSRTPPLIQAVTLFLAVASERVKDHIDDEAGVARLALILLTLVQLVWVVPGLLVGAIYTSFHSQKYRLLTLLGMILTIYNLILDGTLLAKVKPPHGLAITSCLMIILLSSWFLWNQSRTFSLSNKPIDSISFQSLATMENQLWNQSLGSTLTASQAVLGMLAEGLHKSKHLTNFQKRKVQNDGPRGHHEHMTLFANYLFDLYFAKYNNKQQTMDIEWAFSFAYFLLRWKKQVYLLMALHRSLNSATLSLRHSVSLAVLEAAITRQLQTQDAQFSYFFSESSGSQNTQTKTKSARLDIYHIIDTVSAFERLVDQMRIQLRLQSQFLTAVESRSQPVAAVHSAVAVITEQRSVCKQLFDELHAAADSAQTFHLLPFAFFLEHTENNLERRVELVKTYYFKSQVRRVHGRLFNELVDESVTLVSESDRSKLGQITHSSKNAALVFGADDVGALEGRSLDLFFHAEMAAAHRRQMREYLQHFDRPYLGDERERYVTLGNGVYYRVECVTKFVPHLREGFQFVTKLKHLGEDEGKYGKIDDAGIQLVIDDNLRIQGIGYNHSLVKRTDMNDEATRNAASKKEHSTNKVALNAALSILSEVEGKHLSALSYELAQKVNEKLEQLHLTLSGQAKPADPPVKPDLDLKNLASIDSTPELSVRPNQALSSHKVSAKDPKSHGIPLQSLGSPVMESGDFIIAIDVAKGFVISEADNEISGSEFSDDEQAHMKVVEQDSKLRLFLNFTHFCFIPKGPEIHRAAVHNQNVQQPKNKGRSKSPMWQIETKMLGYESKSNEKDEFASISQTRFGAGMTLIRIQNPNKMDNLILNNTMERANLSLDRKNSVYEIAGEFDPLKLITRLINIRNCQELIHNYMTRPELAEIGLDPPTNEETNIEPQLLKPIDSAPVCTPMAGKSSAGKALLQKFIPEGQLQLSIPDRYSGIRTSSLENNVASVQSVEQSQSHTQLATLMPWQTSREKEKEKEGKAILGKKHGNKVKKTSMTLGANAETHRDPTTASQKTSILGPGKEKHGQKGIITKTIQSRSARQKFHTTTVQQHKLVDKEEGSLKSHKTKSKGASQKNEDQLFLGEHGTKKSARDDLVASIGGQSIASSRMSEIHINRSIWFMVRHPTANKSSKIVVLAVMVLYWTFCHTYQTMMLETFAATFSGIANLQNLFGLFINFDSYAKATLNNILDRSLTFEDFGYPADRFATYNPKLVDITQRSAEELPLHLEQAYNYQKYMTANLSLLQVSEVIAFTRKNQVFKNLTIKSTEVQDLEINLVERWTNSLQVSLMVLYDLRVWNEDITSYGSWAAKNLYHDSIKGWYDLLKQITETFGNSYSAQISELDSLSVIVSLCGLAAAQVLIVVIVRQINMVRTTIIKNITVVQCLRAEEIQVKQHRLAVIDGHLAQQLYVGSDGKSSISVMLSVIHKPSRQSHRESGPTSGSREKTVTKAHHKKDRQKKGIPVTHTPDVKVRLAKGSASKVKSSLLSWFGMGIFVCILIGLIELQSGINLLTAANQRKTSELYRDWLDINEHYYLLAFYMSNMPAAIHIDNCGDAGLFDLVEDLHPYVYEYSEKLDKEAVHLVRHVLEKKSEADSYGYQKFFQNPCDLIDLSVYDLPKESCNMLNSGVIQTGYIRFLDIERLNYIKLNHTLHDEHIYHYHTSETKDFTVVAFHLKNIHHLMFPLINRDILAAAENFNRITWEFAFTYGVIIQILLSISGCVTVVVWMFVADAKLSTAVSVYLILPAESLALNHYIRAQMKMLFDGGKFE